MTTIRIRLSKYRFKNRQKTHPIHPFHQYIEETIEREQVLKLNLNFTVVSIVIFQSIWMLCVLAGTPWFGLGALLLALHFYLSPSPKADAVAMLLIAMSGVVFDFALFNFGFYAFDGGFPLWLAFLWCAFGATFYHCFGWLIKQAMPIQALLGGIGGPLSYFAGMKANAVAFPEPLFQTLTILAVFWSAFFIVACKVKRSGVSYAPSFNS